MSIKLVSRSSTLEAARTVYFIVVGLAIKQSLGLFSHTWPSKDFPNAPDWNFWVRATIALGYLVTVIRFSHGVTLLFGHEKERIENSNLPSATKISELSLFLVLLAVPLFLMADNIIELDSYIFWSAALLAVDFAYVLRSKVVRHPFKRILRILNETDRGYAAHAAIWWMATDAALFVVCCTFYFRSSVGTTLAMHPPARELVFASVLILGAVADYWLNWDFYFGGREDRRRQKFVFVISPLRNENMQIYKDNINRAQLYCLNLMNWQGHFGKRVTPLASHAFFTYFLNDRVGIDRRLGLECMLAYLSACDAVHVYVPFRPTRLKAPLEKGLKKKLIDLLGLRESFNSGLLNKLVEKPNKGKITPGMRHALDTAKRNGLQIKYQKAITSWPSPDVWPLPNWSSISYERLEDLSGKPSESYFKGADQRKKVYVCTRFRGKDFDPKGWPRNDLRLKSSTRLALWHCHELAKDPNEALAPFAPQAFYPYFWKFTGDDKVDGRKTIENRLWEAWFDRSIEMLKVCDAVYIYTTEGLPPTAEDDSKGVFKVDRMARKLGLEIQYRKELRLPKKEWWQAEKDAKKALSAAEKASTLAAAAERAAIALRKAADSVRAELGADQPGTNDAEGRAQAAQQKADELRAKAEEARRNSDAKRKELTKKTWNPALPIF